MFKYYTKTGKIGFDDSVFARIAIETAEKMGNAVIFTNAKGKPVRIGREGDEKLNFIGVKLGEEKNTVNMEIYVILKFGTSISRMSQEFARRLRAEVKSVTGVRVDKIRIVVKGVRSKNTVKRELEIKC